VRVGLQTILYLVRTEWLRSWSVTGMAVYVYWPN
jgi:hypothetical protein